jgi:protein-tyrosine phosphatase
VDRDKKRIVKTAKPAQQRKRVLFICSGNYYRSRLAEILFNHGAPRAGLKWDATSRGLLSTGELRGMSEHAIAYLKANKMKHLATEPRNPLVLDVEDLTGSDLIVAMCLEEHKPMVEKKFLALAKALHKAGTIRYWNIYDIPGRPRSIVRLLGGGHKGPSQPADSGTEHIALAVNALIQEMRNL